MTMYPEVMPTEALMLLLDKVRGKEVAVSELVHGAWNVLGYGLNQALPLPMTIGDDGSLPTDEQALLSLLGTENPNVVGFGILPGIAISIVIKLALKLLAQYIM